MVMTEHELAARDAQRDIGAELLEAIRQVKAGQVGRVYQVPVPLALEARQRLGLSQAQFARALQVSKRTLQEWEQNRRQPSGAAKALLKIAISRPESVHEALASH